jgi:thiamine pyrophosphokinase
MLDADQVLSIFCYLIVGARVDHLHTHLFILDNFSSSHQMISMTGYYLSVIRCAVEQLENEYSEFISRSSRTPV